MHKSEPYLLSGAIQVLAIYPAIASTGKVSKFAILECRRPRLLNVNLWWETAKPGSRLQPSIRMEPKATTQRHIPILFPVLCRPVSSATPQQGSAPLTVNFDASNSTGDIVSYMWDFGDGETSTNTSTTSHIYPTPGTYTATLKTTDGSGATHQKSIDIKVTESSGSNTPPSASITTTTSAGNVPLSVSFDGSGSTDSDGSIDSYAWDFGDGSTAFGLKTSHSYTIAGSYSPTLMVTDNDGATDSISAPVIVEPAMTGNNIPIAKISASANRGNIPLTITFDGNKCHDSDGTITAYTWNFGDGTTSSGKVVKHTFTVAATYTISLRVTDSDGGKSQPTTTKVVTTDKATLGNGNGRILLQPILKLLLDD